MSSPTTANLQRKLRRIALNQQGLLLADTFGRGKKATLRAIEHIGYVQIDTISVVERAHHHVLWSRVSNYRPEFLDQLMKERHLFEYWYHAAAWLPMRDYRFALPRMNAKNVDRDWFEKCDKKLIRLILNRIKEEGPLRARDFEDTRRGKKEWWDWKPAKRALEQLFMLGELMASHREGFQKVYDLRERVLPDWVDTREPTLLEYADHLIDTTIRAHGFATQKSMTYLRKGKALREAITEQLNARVDAKLLSALTMENNNVAYIDAGLLDAHTRRSSAGVRILSPFDNAVIQRDRGRDIFNFDYQIECYVPEKKRQFGYFCLPVLYRDTLVGRIDCKAHRKEKRLEIKSIHLEQSVDNDFHGSFLEAIERFAKFNACVQVDLPKTFKPGHQKYNTKLS
jgi:uncharacterized protein YcaQ